MPAFGRFALTRICLKQLRRTCDALTAEGIPASAIVVADDDNLDVARRWGFGTVRRDNKSLSRRFNDAIQLALDERHNPRPVSHVALIGSDDWVDHRLFVDLPSPDELLAFRWASFVSENGRWIAPRFLDYRGGVGIRVYPRSMMEASGFRPAEEDRDRFCDMAIFVGVSKTCQPQIGYGDIHEFQIVDWKTSGTQLNGYESIVTRHRQGKPPSDTFEALEGFYPETSLAEMRAHYDLWQTVAA
jgi:hypothetical protein